MIIVKLTFNYDFPIFRQTENFSKVWGNYKFVIDENLKECDFWIVYTDYNLKAEKVKCAPENIIFIPGECYHTSPKFNQNFLNQFGLIITVFCAETVPPQPPVIVKIILLVPAATPVTNPEELTVATAVLLLLHAPVPPPSTTELAV